MWRPNLTLNTSPKYRGLENAIHAAVETGELSAGDKLPPVRELAWHLAITPGTVARAYTNLRKRGILAAHTGRGTFVADGSMPNNQTPLIPEGGPLSLASVEMPDMGQTALLRDALRTTAQSISDVALLQYPTRSAKENLHRAIFRQFIEGMPVGPVEPDDIVLSYGAQAADFLIMTLMTRSEHAAIGVDELHYLGFQEAAKAIDRPLISIEWDDEGPLPRALEKAAREQSMALYATTADANVPSTRPISMARRHEICAVARAFDFHILDDLCYLTGVEKAHSLRDIAPERCWLSGSMSKIFSGALRIGWCIPPQGYKDAFLNISRMGNAFGVSQIQCETLFHVLDDPRFPVIMQKTKAFLQRRTVEMAERFAEFEPMWSKEVPYMLLPLPARWTSAQFAQEVAICGVRVRSIEEFTVQPSPNVNAVRLAVNGAMSEAQWHEALDRVLHCIRGMPEGPSI